MASVTRFITLKLKLTVNQTKSALAHCAPGGGPIQGASPGTDASDAGSEHRANGERPDPVSAGMARLFRQVRNARGVARP